MTDGTDTELTVTDHARDRYAQRELGFAEGVGEAIREGAIESQDDADARIRQDFGECIPCGYLPQTPEREGVMAKIHPETIGVFLYSIKWSETYLQEVPVIITYFDYDPKRTNENGLRLSNILKCGRCGRLYWPSEHHECEWCGAPQESAERAKTALAREIEIEKVASD